MNFEPVLRKFNLVYNVIPKINLNESVIFVNKDLDYPTDFIVSTSRGQGVTIKRDNSNHHLIVEQSLYFKHVYKSYYCHFAEAELLSHVYIPL